MARVDATAGKRPQTDGWEPSTYEAFADARMRPLEDLLARIPLPPGHVGSVLDAGCGTGKGTALLARRFPAAQVLGVDRSERMLMHAPTGPRLRFRQEDLATWAPGERFDLVVANAVLHWIPDPSRTIRRLMGWVAPAGCLAFQVPANFRRPSHRITRETAAAHGIGADAGDHVLPLAEYATILEEAGFEVDAWEATYLHVLRGPDPVLKWLSGTTLRPYVLSTSPEQGRAFLDDLRLRLADAYPPAADGRVHFPFTRRFVVARDARADQAGGLR